MQTLMIKAATRESGQALHSALERFGPELDGDEDDGYVVSIGLGSDRRVLEVFDAIQDFLAEGAAQSAAGSMTVALDGHSYTLHT